MTASRNDALVRSMPAVFVLIWSTGFIVARFGMPHAPPMKFLLVRYLLSAACLTVWASFARAAWPRGTRQWLHLAVTGVFMHAGYLGGVWAAVKAGMGAGLSALLVGLQPVLTAIWLSATSTPGGAGQASPGRAVSPRQWAGLALGLAGLLLVLWHRLGVGEVTGVNLSFALLALASITTGTLYQKRWVQPCDVRTANLVQLMAAALVTLPLALLETESMRWQAGDGTINLQLAGAMAWSVVGLTLGASSLLYLLIQRGAATSVASLMYLVPPCTAVMAWVLFGEPIEMLTVAGIALTATGVSLVVRAPAASTSPRAAESVSRRTP